MMKNEVKIRHATPADIPLIRDLVYRVWPQTYASILSQDRIDYMLEYMYSAESLQKQMNAGSQFIVVYDAEEPVGYAAYLSRGHGIYKLDKIYVLPSQQGKGTGRFVIDYVIEEIKQQGARALQLQVNRRNTAKSFYERLGFVVIDYQEFDIGHGHVMDDYIMEKKLD